MLPLSLLKAAESRPMLIELKNGDTYNGRLVNCNMFMNICLRDVICTSRDGDKFWKLPECYIRGNAIKYLRLPEEIIDLVPQDSHHAESRLIICLILSFHLCFQRSQVPGLREGAAVVDEEVVGLEEEEVRNLEMVVEEEVLEEARTGVVEATEGEVTSQSMLYKDCLYEKSCN